MKKLFLVMVLVCTTMLQLFAQNRQISGKVTSSDDGSGLPGVSVSIKGTSKGVTTDNAGNYRLSISDGTSLVFSFVGYKSQTISIGNRSVVDVVLTAENQQLSEVVVVGYGVQKRQEFTGSASTIKSAVIAERPVQSFSQGLTGQAAGVNITQPNGLLNNPPVIRVRGLSSLSLSSFPLVVIDGIPISTDNVSANSTTNNPLADINPSDIETIDVLKDAASSAIYGSRAGAGVLLITTKRGKAGKEKFHLIPGLVFRRRFVCQMC